MISSPAQAAFKTISMPALSLFLILCLSAEVARGGSATWNLNPTDGDWNTSANWTPATVPNGPSDIATFDVSSVVDVSISANSAKTRVSSIVFNSGASAFTIAPDPGTVFDITGTGITNDSGVMQNVVTTADTNLNHVFLQFYNSANAGTSMTYTNKAAPAFTDGGQTLFLGNSNAGSATFINEGGAMPSSSIVGGSLWFMDKSSAGDATVMNYGGTAENALGGEVSFGAVSVSATSTAANAFITNYPATAPGAQGGSVAIYRGATGGDATIVNNGASVSGAGGGVTAVWSGGSPGNCTLIANGGSNGGGGGGIFFYLDSDGGTPRVQVFGNGFLDTSNSNVAIGSLEGDGQVSLGNLFPLTVGTNNFDTIFSGTIVGVGPVKKVGTGTLTLTGANLLTRGFTVVQGRLEVSNQRGSGTGSGPVAVRGGKLGGRGTIAGSVTVGTADGQQGFLSPGRHATRKATTATLTIQKTLTFDATGVYIPAFNSDIASSDSVSANGVTIGSGAEFYIDDAGSTALAAGTVFTIVNNTAGTPIAGTFSDLPDGGLAVAGNNTFQANYEGGDGNDLTLTVVSN